MLAHDHLGDQRQVAAFGWSASSITLFAFGLILVVVGAYFILIRPPLLPEDLRYLGTSQTALDAAVPHLTLWLNHVFLVLGGYISATGMPSSLREVIAVSCTSGWTASSRSNSTPVYPVPPTMPTLIMFVP